MKHSLFIIFCLCFALTGCNHTETPTTNTASTTAPINTGATSTGETTIDKANQTCADNSPLKNNNFKKIYWAFANQNNDNCWYLGYMNDNFFLINNENYERYKAVGTNLEETIKVTIDWYNDFDSREGNKLYADSVDEFFDLQDKISQKYFDNHLLEYVSFYNYSPDTIGQFLQKFEQYNIKLPPNAILTQNDDLNYDFSPENIKNLEEKNTTSDIDLWKLYDILYEKQKP